MLKNILRISLASISTYLTLSFASLAIIAADKSLSGSPSTTYDFDNDGKADISVFRPTSGIWYIANIAGLTAVHFGLADDRLVAADYDGDGRSDIAVYRNGVWWVLESSTNTYNAVYFGVDGDIPVPADLDGDGRADAAVFRPSLGQWFWSRTSEGTVDSVIFGLSGDIPLPADYDGDGRADINVYRPSTGAWYTINSSNGAIAAAQFGLPGDKPVQGDFDGDGRTDIGVWRPSDGHWFLIYSANSSFHSTQFGLAQDIPVSADYDGDGKADIAVFRPASSYWYRQNSSDGTINANPFGIITDVPIPGHAFISYVTTATATSTPTLTPTPTNTASATPTNTPSRTPTNTATATATPSSTPIPPSFTCDYYASPAGTAGGSGLIGSPWNLQSALNKTAQVTAGKTLCLRGGTYRGKFISTLNGGTVRSYPGEWAVLDGYVTTTLAGSITSTQTSVTLASMAAVIGSGVILIDDERMQTGTPSGSTVTVVRGWDGTTPAAHSSGATVVMSGNQLYVSGSNATYRDFEVMNSCPTRDFSTQLAKTNTIGVFGLGSGNSYINLIVHDNGGGGFFTGSSSSNTTLYGNLVYNNGVHNTTHGHGLYLENTAGYSRIYDTMVLNNFNLGVQAYGVTGPYVGGDMRGLVVAGSGSPVGEYHQNLIYGPDSVKSPTGSITESVFHHFPGQGYSVNMGYGAGVGSATVTNNYFFGSQVAFEANNVDSLTFTGNKFDGATGDYAHSRLQPYNWDNNTYYRLSGSSARLFQTAVGGYVFPLWRTVMGFDASGTTSSSPMPNTVIVRPNAYEAGRASIVTYAPSNPSSITVNLSTSGLIDGQTYVIRNAFNFNGPAVLTGVYNAASPTVSLPLNGAALTVARPLAMSLTPPTTCPTFCAFIVNRL